MINEKRVGWQGIKADQRMCQCYNEFKTTLTDEIFASLFSPEITGVKLKPLKCDYEAYSLRLSKGKRAIFTRAMVNGKPYLQLRAIGEHAIYEKKLLTPQDEKRYQSKLIPNDLLDLGFHVAPVEQSVTADTPETPTPDTSYKESFTVFDKVQSLALNSPLPLLISGTAGSGKTKVALEFIRRMIANMLLVEEADRPAKILYLCPNEGLLADTIRDWNQSPQSESYPKDMVEFMTTAQLLQSLGIVLNQDNSASPQTFARFFEDYRKTCSRHNAIPRSITAELLYQERCVLLGYPDSEPYLNPGKSRLTKAQREIVIRVTRAYQLHCEEKGLIDPVAVPLPTLQRYRYVLADEAQNMSRHFLAQLGKLGCGDQVIYLMDSQQGQVYRDSLRPWLLEMPRMRHVYLDQHYRSSECVVEFANAWTWLKYCFTGGKNDTKEQQSMIVPDNMKGRRGDVRILPQTGDIAEWIRATYSNRTDFAIITSACFVAEAKALYGSDLVFTPDNAAGLGFSTLLYHRPLDDERLAEANKLLRQGKVTIRDGRTRGCAREGDGDPGFAPVFQEKFTGFTRAIDTLLIVQHSHHACDLLLEHMQQEVQRQQQISQPAQSSSSNQAPAAAPTKTWAEMEALLRERGNIDQADAIRHTKLGMPSPSTTTEDSSPKAAPKPKAAKRKPAKKTSRQAKKPEQSEFERQTEVLFKRIIELSQLPEAALQTQLQSVENKTCFDVVVRKQAEGFPLFNASILDPTITTKNPKLCDKINVVIARILLNFGLNSPVSTDNPLTCLHHLLRTKEGGLLFLKLLKYEPFFKSITLTMWLDPDPARFKSPLYQLSTYVQTLPDFRQQFLAAPWRANLRPILNMAAVKAVQGRLAESFEALQKLGFDPSAVFMPDGMTPLHMAAQKNSVNILFSLLTQNVMNSAMKSTGNTAGHLAAQNGHHQAFLYLWRTNPRLVRCKNINQELPIVLAIKNAHVTFLKEVVNAGFDHGLTPAETHNLLNDMLKIDISTAHLEALYLCFSDTELRPFIHYAAEKGRVDLLTSLYDKGLNLMYLNIEGNNVIKIAAHFGQIAVIQWLHSRGYDVIHASKYQLTAMNLAVQSNHHELVRVLHAMGGVLTMGDAMRAIQTGAVETLKLMKELGVNLSEVNDQGMNLVFFAVQENAVSMIEPLRDAGVDLNQSVAGLTPLLKSIMQDRVLMIEALKCCGASMESPTGSGSILHFAAQCGSEASFSAMLGWGMDPLMPDSYGASAIASAAFKGRLGILTLIHQQNPALLSVVTPKGSTLLHFAAGNACNNTVAWLREHAEAIDVKAQKEDGNTAAHLATQVNAVKVLKILGEMDESVFLIANNDGLTPIMVAAGGRSQLDAFRFLLDCERVRTSLDTRKCVSRAVEADFADGIKELRARGLISLNEFGEEMYRRALNCKSLSVIKVLEAARVISPMPITPCLSQSFFGSSLAATSDTPERPLSPRHE